MIRARFQFGEYELIVVQVLLSSYGTFNYLLCRDGKATLIDAGQAKPIFQTLEEENLQLMNVLITHAHNDHTGGCRAIQDRLGVQSTSPGVEAVEFPMIGTLCRAISTPGHTAVHKCYCFPEIGILFTGDTIISGACGRILGGTAEQYFQSLDVIKSLPDEMRVFGGHDYLEDNMRFALSVEPDNAAMKARLERYQTDPSAAIFTTLGEEKKTNPFLRVQALEEFTALRRAKDQF
ncbi:MAG: MBL fold metallo-hydrolase [Kiritimatiellaceae bacterium]|nr:MBL fold metallo-hydrolase [Kiritimatiellaceae bacterium]